MWSTFDRVWAGKPPLRFSWIKEYMFIYLQTDYEMHWILLLFYRIFRISIFNTCSYGELITGVSPNMLCRYKWHACRLTCTDTFLNVPTNFQMYRQKSEKTLLGGGGGAIAPPPRPPLATLMYCSHSCKKNCWIFFVSIQFNQLYNLCHLVNSERGSTIYKLRFSVDPSTNM